MADTDELRRKALAELARRRYEAQAKPVQSDVPEGMFMNPNTGQVTDREMRRRATPTSPLRAAGMGYMQGYSYNSADEAAGALGGTDEARATFLREDMRAQDEALAEAHPIAYTGGKIAGAVLSPISKLFGAANTVGGAIRAGAGAGAVDSYMGGEGDDRGTKAAQGAVTGAFFSGMVGGLAKGGTGYVRRAFERAEKRPSIETLKGAKNAAYAAVRRSGVEFDPNDTRDLYRSIRTLGTDPRWDLDAVSEIDSAAFDALRVLERRAQAGKVSLDNLDKTRQKMWDIYNRSEHPFVLEAISAIDDTIASKAAGNDLMRAARDANSKYAKAQLLENAFKKARLQTASTGSGGNIMNKYKQAVTSILTKPHERKWFSDEELSLMEHFVDGNNAENALRRIGKLSPGGNGLMTALNVYAASVDPSMLAITGVATAAKTAADRSAMQGSEDLLKSVSTGVIKPPPKPLPMREIGIGAGVGVPDYLRNRNGVR